jgi:glycosyltransferase involved in cell wall biosynthesis
MKILMLGWELPPHNSGGLGVACFQLCKSLASNKMDIDFIVPYEADHSIDFMNVIPAIPQGVDSILKSGIAYDSYKFIYSNGKVKDFNIIDQYHAYSFAASKIAETREFDVVHAHDWLTFRAALLIKQKTDCPIILHVHSVESDRSGSEDGNPMVKEIEETAMLMADEIIAVSNHTKNKIISDYNIPENKIKVVHNSIDVIAQDNNSLVNSYEFLKYMKSRGYKVVANIGRLTVQKGLPNFLKAARRVIDVNPKTYFLIVGSGEQYHELVDLAAELGISDKVIFTEFQRGQQWRDAFKIADLFVMPSVSEPFGLTPLEAIAFGTPSLVSKQSGVSEVFKNCLKVDFWDIDEMSNLIASSISSDALLEELSNRAYDEYRVMSWQDSTDKLMDLYRHHKTLAEAAR